MAQPKQRQTMGFTLLELLVVLLLAALLSGLAFPNAQRWIAGAQERAWQRELHSALQRLPVLARQQGQPLVIDEAALRQRVPRLPDEVELRLERPLRYQANGVASPGRLDILRPGRPNETWQILALTGEPQRP